MIVLRDRFLHLDAVQAWWPESPDAVYPLLGTAAVVTVRQCTAEVAERLKSVAFRWRPFQTLVLDLSRPEEELWRSVQPRTRFYIKNGAKLGGRFLVNEKREHALALINEAIQRQRFRPPISVGEWHDVTAHGDVFLMAHEDRPIAAHVALVDHPRRAGMLFGATADRNDPGIRHLIGPLSKKLVWSVCIHYKAKEVQCYDFGGVDLDERSPLYSISRFKVAFGGRPVTEYNLRLSGRRLLRSVLSVTLAARLKLKAAVPGW